MKKTVFTLMFGVLLGASATNAVADVYRALSDSSFIFGYKPYVTLWQGVSAEPPAKEVATVNWKWLEVCAPGQACVTHQFSRAPTDGGPEPFVLDEILAAGGQRAVVLWTYLLPGFDFFQLSAVFPDHCSIFSGAADVCMALSFTGFHPFPAGTKFSLALSASKVDYLSFHIPPTTNEEASIVVESAGKNVILSWVSPGYNSESLGFPNEDPAYNAQFIRVGR